MTEKAAEDDNQDFVEDQVQDPAPEDRDADFSQLDQEAEVTQLRAQAEENHNKYLRALADFENFKKRVMKERSDQLKYQGEKVFLDVVEIIDNLELALKHAEAEPEKLKEGVELIYQMFRSTLDKWEVKPRPGKGEVFDPNIHSAISQVPTDQSDPGTIIDELKAAYFYKDRLLRPGEVVVATAPVQQEAGGQGADGSEGGE